MTVGRPRTDRREEQSEGRWPNRHRWHHGGEHDRDCEVLEFRHENGEPPKLVRRGDTGYEDLLFPGPGASVVGYGNEW